MKTKIAAYEVTLTDKEAARHPDFVCTDPITVTSDEDGWFAEIETNDAHFYLRFGQSGWCRNTADPHFFKTVDACFKALKKGI